MRTELQLLIIPKYRGEWWDWRPPFFVISQTAIWCRKVRLNLPRAGMRVECQLMSETISAHVTTSNDPDWCIPGMSGNIGDWRCLELTSWLDLSSLQKWIYSIRPPNVRPSCVQNELSQRFPNPFTAFFLQWIMHVSAYPIAMWSK